ncbi:TetR/AcrR family transcriptional regulator [Neobacillus bataviensis]|uniref:TetR/AcrR family transcriptional regulator n=1 Tax=Neobacillus bataviensis TaxID=220685 RepID=UPI0021D8E322|nr:TetR/AcrR family transcriptional regulator [Neobacillus bataviensis]
MREKEKIIIEAGMKLFASKGFSSTSIQEIATESGISKGAFYLHFKSKDELLLAILEYIFETVHSSISIYEQQNLPPRDKFIKQLSSLFGTFLGHKEFLIMLSKEQAIPRNEKIKNLMFEKHHENHLLFRKGLVSIYGKEIEPYSVDLAMILEGLFHAYMRLMFFEPDDFDFEGLTQYLLRRLDSIVKEITSEKPFLTEDKLKKVLIKSKNLFDHVDIPRILQKMREELSQLENKEAVEISLDVLEEEIKKESPRIPVIKGMLSNLKDVKEFKDYVSSISSFYSIED